MYVIAQNIPLNWDVNLTYQQQKQFVRGLIQHVINDQRYIGYQDSIDYYSYYDDDYELHKCEHTVVNRRRFIECLMTPNHSFRFWL